jgi:CubicO group peptidase (beta-lactamase class C family)
MRSGFHASGLYYTVPRDLLRRSFACHPGTCFVYDDAASQLLSIVLSRATGAPAADFARKRFFRPLGITDSRWSWPATREGDTVGAGGLSLTARDMARVGVLLLHMGRWRGHQLVPASYISAATSPQVELPSRPGAAYGWQFWVFPDGFAAIGRGGQAINVIPRSDLVVVTRGDIDAPDTDLEALVQAVIGATR